LGQVVAVVCVLLVTVYVLMIVTVEVVAAEETVRVVVPEGAGVTVLQPSKFMSLEERYLYRSHLH
jgi:hypothetical protein